jgi:phosphate-selective porin
MHGAARRTFVDESDARALTGSTTRRRRKPPSGLSDRASNDSPIACTSDALVGAFVDGALYAAVELTAQMVEAGEPAYLEQDVVPADAGGDYGDPV